MAIRTRNILKGWFKTLAKPLEAQFWDWIDSFRHVDEKIAPADLAPELLDLLNALPDQGAITQILQELSQKATLQQLQTLQQQVDGLSGGVLPVTLEVSEDSSYIIPAGRLMHKIVAVAGNAETSIFIGYSNVTDELAELTNITAGLAASFAVDHYKPQDYTIFFNGITAPLTIKIYII